MGHRKRNRKSSQQMGAEPSVESRQARWQCDPNLRAAARLPLALRRRVLCCPLAPCELAAPPFAPQAQQGLRGGLAPPVHPGCCGRQSPAGTAGGLALRNTPPAAGSPGQWTGSKLGKEYDKAVYCHPALLTCMKSTSCEMPGWMNHKLESGLWGEISITSDMRLP